MPWLWALLGAGVLYYLARDDGPPGLALDAEIDPDTRTAVTFAWNYENDGAQSHAFAQSLMPDLPISAHLLARKSGQSVSGVQMVGGFDPLDPSDYVNAASSAVTTTVDVITHPADTASGAWHIITHPSDSISDFANACVDALHAIPGMDEAGELLKDFAHTALGEWCLRIMATFGYYVLAPYLGCGLAAISFALPGACRADPFLASWITETMDRVIKTINILLAGALGNISNAADQAVNEALAQVPDVQALAKEFTEQIGKATSVLTSKLGAYVAQKIKDGASDALDEVTKKLAAEYGYPPNFAKLAAEAGIREDNAAAAYDLLAHTHYQTTTLWDPITGEDIQSHLHYARYQSIQSLTYRDPRMMSSPELENTRVSVLTWMLTPPERRKWVQYYLHRARYTKSGVLAAAYLRTHPQGDSIYGPPSSFVDYGSVAQGAFYVEPPAPLPHTPSPTMTQVPTDGGISSSLMRFW